MKIEDARKAGKAQGAAKPAKAGEASGAPFVEAIRDAEDRGVVDRLRGLADKIAAQGDKLLDKVDIRELHAYKKLISEFMDEAVGNSRQFSKQSFLDRRGRHKVFAVIKKVNEELDELTREVLSEEKDRIRMLKRLDDIKGLILDIIL
jgi:uncharacterized protein YaaR (DUF327 family)